MKYFIVRPKAKPVRRNRRKSARKLLGLSMTAGLVLLIGSAGALDCGAVPAGQAFAQAAFGLALFGGCGLALRRTEEKNPSVKKKESCRREPGSPRPQNRGEDRRSQYSTTGRKSQ